MEKALSTHKLRQKSKCYLSVKILYIHVCSRHTKHIMHGVHNNITNQIPKTNFIHCRKSFCQKLEMLSHNILMFSLFSVRVSTNPDPSVPCEGHNDVTVF
jgi:hypothetical protein